MLIWRLISRHIRRRRVQSALFVLGIALGVAVGVAIDLANTSANRAFTLSTETIAGDTTHQIVGSSVGFDESVYHQLPQTEGLKAAPVIEKYVRALDYDELPLRLMGVDLQAEQGFRSNLEGAEDQVVSLDPATIALSPNPIFISHTFAQRHQLALGDTLRLRVNTQQLDATIVGILQPTDSLSAQSIDDLLMTDWHIAQTMLQMPAMLTRIDLILPEGYDADQLKAQLPPQVTLTTPARRAEALSEMTSAFRLNLQALSLLGLVVGVFLIYNTVMFSVVQRRPVLGIMRSLGTSRRQIFLLVLGEALLLGTIGTIGGLILGVIMGQATVSAVSQTVSDLYFRVNVQSVTIPPTTLLRGAIIGMAASVGAAFIPAIDATQTTPAGSMRRSDLEQGATRLIPYVTGIALAMILTGVCLLLLESKYIVISFVALFSTITGAALLTPLGMILLARLLTPISAGIFGVLGRMAPRALIRSISRTAVAVAALTLAVSVIVGVGAMITSFRTSVVDWLDVILGADVFISTPDSSTDSSTDLDPALLEALRQVDGVQTVASVREVRIISPDYPDLPPIRVIAVDVDLSHGKREFVWFADGVTQENYFETLSTGPKVAVTEAFAVHRNITKSNPVLTLLTDQGPQTFEVIGFYQDYTSDQGNIYMTQTTYRQYWDDPYLTNIAAILTPEADMETVMQAMREGPLAGLDLEVQSNRDLKASAMEIFDRTFSITIALQLLAIIVSFIGILSSLLALQLEHVREYGIMRANGMTPNQLRRFTLLQTGIMGMIAGILALPIGLILAFMLIYVINVRSFGWTMNLVLSPKDFIQAFLVALIAALLAGIYPAWKVSSIKPAEAVRSE